MALPSGQIRQGVVDASGERREGDFEMTAAVDRVYLTGPGGHLYTHQPLTSWQWAEPLAG